MSSEGQGARLARNQSVFRTVNEQIDGINSDFERLFDVRGAFVCECAATECLEPIEIAGDEYERVREHGARFVVAPGAKHFAGEPFERLIEKRETYWVVEKVGTAGAVSQELAPRD